MQHMPLAPHRADLPRSHEAYWFFHRTQTNVSDFASFVEYESTQVKMDHDFYLGNDRNRSEKEGNLVPKDKWIKFEQGKSYHKDLVRQYLFEYYVSRASWSRHEATNRKDGARYWFFAKSIKDYIVLTGK